MSDPYQILGVTKSATDAEIKSAYRKLAKKYHPDMNPGRKDIEHKFKEITAAYDLLSDAPKRARFDRGEIDGAGNEKAYGFGGARGARESYQGNFGFNGMDDFLSEFFGGARRGPQPESDYTGFSRHRHEQPRRAKGHDVTYSLQVPFVEACKGGTQRVTLASGKTIDVTIPKGTESGHKLRLRSLGVQGDGGAGDAIIEITVAPHAFFTRKENDIHLDVPISLAEAMAGGPIKVPTLDGSVMLKVPARANSGAVLRLKGKGVPLPDGRTGDMFARLVVTLPDPIPQDLADLVEKWSRKNPYDPRRKMV